MDPVISCLFLRCCGVWNKPTGKYISLGWHLIGEIQISTLSPYFKLHQATPELLMLSWHWVSNVQRCSKLQGIYLSQSRPQTNSISRYIMIYRGTPSPVDKDIHEISGLLSFDNFRVSAPSKLEPGAGWTDGREWGGLARDGELFGTIQVPPIPIYPLVI